MHVLIVPRLDVVPEALVLDDRRLPPDLVARVSDYLDERRMVTTAVEIRTPSYQGVTVVARLTGARAAATSWSATARSARCTPT